MKVLKSVAVITLLSLTVPSLTFSSTANASTGMTRSSDRSEVTLPSFHDRDESYQVGAALANCRRVNTNGGRLHVRRTPGGRIIGALPYGTYVRITHRGEDGWVRIASPIRGYVYANYLTYCR